VYEGLWEVAVQLALGDVELFPEPGGAACGAVSLKPACGGEVVALLGVRECHQEPAQQERAF
jgi:hypothetical protein